MQEKSPAITDTWTVEIMRIEVGGQHWQKVIKIPISINKLGMVHTLVISATWDVICSPS
jgi:hypothetical protein